MSSLTSILPVIFLFLHPNGKPSNILHYIQCYPTKFTAHKRSSHIQSFFLLHVTRSRVLCLSPNKIAVQTLNIKVTQLKVNIWHHSLLIHIQYNRPIKTDNNMNIAKKVSLHSNATKEIIYRGKSFSSFRVIFFLSFLYTPDKKQFKVDGVLKRRTQVKYLWDMCGCVSLHCIYSSFNST